MSAHMNLFEQSQTWQGDPLDRGRALLWLAQVCDATCEHLLSLVPSGTKLALGYDLHKLASYKKHEVFWQQWFEYQHERALEPPLRLICCKAIHRTDIFSIRACSSTRAPQRHSNVGTSIKECVRGKAARDPNSN